jgi:uncharacterized protein YeaO (DUF488 family)
MTRQRLQIKRVYQPPDTEDGVRVLVDRLWPRGLSRERAQIDLWLKEIAPSDALRRRCKRAPSRTRLLAVRNGGTINSKAEEAKAAISGEDYTAGLASMREDTPCLVAQRPRSR